MAEDQQEHRLPLPPPRDAGGPALFSTPTMARRPIPQALGIKHLTRAQKATATEAMMVGSQMAMMMIMLSVPRKIRTLLKKRRARSGFGG